MLLKKLLNVFFPRTCAGCAADIPAPADHGICDDCWNALPRWTGLSCAVCGLALPDGGARCRDCRRRRRGFRFLRSAGLYEGALQRLVLKFKFGGREDLARPLGRMLSDFWADEGRLGPVDGVVPVPLHWVRQRARGYDQALLLARVFGHGTGVAVWEGVLRRRRATKPQTELGRDARQENVRDAFDVKRRDAVRGKRILLVDDVCTTGATLESCARALRAAGARHVGALTVARQVPF